ncbi:MAG: DUF4013 domain-containing protein [Methanosphaera sp.]|nr:DUF4013 domain-containing protein [Methanosphaera sp.]
MEITQIIEDALRYPLTDYKKFLILGIPNLILGIFMAIFIGQASSLFFTNVNTNSTEFITSPEFYAFIGSSMIVMLLTFLVSIFISGIGISIMRYTFNNKNELPNIEPVKNFIDGLKSYIVAIIYFGVPTILYFILVLVIAAALGDYAGAFVLLLSILYIIAMILLAIMYIVSLGRLAESDSISESLKISAIFEKTKEIGFLRIIGIFIILTIVNIVISLIGTFIEMIPYIGLIIVCYIFYSYIFIVSFRAYALTYKDGNQTPFTQNPTVGVPEPRHDINAVQTENKIDFNPALNDEKTEPEPSTPKVENKPNSNADSFKICEKCGYSNPDFVNICVNCGNKF